MKNWLHENGIKRQIWKFLGSLIICQIGSLQGRNLAASHPRVLFVGRYLLFIVIFYINWDVLHVRSIW